MEGWVYSRDATSLFQVVEQFTTAAEMHAQQTDGCGDHLFVLYQSTMPCIWVAIVRSAVRYLNFSEPAGVDLLRHDQTPENVCFFVFQYLQRRHKTPKEII